MGEHINNEGKFQSDKYPWSEPGFFPLKFTDPLAQPLIAMYAAQKEVAGEVELANDLRICLKNAGWEPPK